MENKTATFTPKYPVSVPIIEQLDRTTVSTTSLLIWGIAVASCLALPNDSRAQVRNFVTGPRLSLGTESRLTASVLAGDVDGDRDLDLVVANGRHWPQQNMVFLNQRRGLFTVARPLGVDLSTSYACELADLDGDGDLDIAVGNDNAPCLIFLNDGNGQFKRRGDVGAPSSVRSLTIADIDNDDDMDLIVTCRGEANQIHFNDGMATFDRSMAFGTRADATIDVAAADLNEDGRTDLILANRSEQPNAILLSEATTRVGDSVRFRSPVEFGAASSSRAVATADFDGDGHVDWVVGNIGNANAVYFGDGKGGVAREITIGQADGETFCIAVADLNRDGLPDIVAGNQRQANSVCYNRAKGQRFDTESFGSKQSATYGLCVGDFNGDGFSDIAVANSGQPNQIFLNVKQDR